MISIIGFYFDIVSTTGENFNNFKYWCIADHLCQKKTLKLINLINFIFRNEKDTKVDPLSKKNSHTLKENAQKFIIDWVKKGLGRHMHL